MTDTQKLDFLIENVCGMRTDMVSMKTEMEVMKSDIDTMKSDIDTMKSDINELQTDVKGLKTELKGLKRYVKKSVSELKSMDEMILDEVERVHMILDKHKADYTVHIAH